MQGHSLVSPLITSKHCTKKASIDSYSFRSALMILNQQSIRHLNGKTSAISIGTSVAKNIEQLPLNHGNITCHFIMFVVSVSDRGLSEPRKPVDQGPANRHERRQHTSWIEPSLRRRIFSRPSRKCEPSTCF